MYLAYGLYYFTDVFIGELENDLEKQGLIREKNRWEKLAKELQKKEQKNNSSSLRKKNKKDPEQRVKEAYRYFSEKAISPTREMVAEKARVSVPTVRKYKNE